MMRTLRPLASLLAAAAAIVNVSAADNQFISTWRAPLAAPVNFTGRKVAAVVISDDTNLRVSGEEALAREITARGPIGVPSYRIIPIEELKKGDAAKTWFERTGVQGIVILRGVKTETEKVYSSFVWTSGYYNYAWDYWGTSWASVYPIGSGREQKTFTVETLMYDVSTGSPIWAGVSRTTDPKDVQSYVKSLAIDIVKQLEKDGVVRPRPR
jgi:hypothetical protein